MNIQKKIPAWLALLPIALLLAALVSIIFIAGADCVSAFGPYAILGAAAATLALARIYGCLDWRKFGKTVTHNFRELFPVVLILICIAMVASTWMLSGIVPTLICYGLNMLNPNIFLFVTCLSCAVVSVALGSSWTTIATMGVVFMGIGSALGYSEGWIAGAVISGAYFGDKVSPLSDTTMIASSTCGVDLLTHIRNIMRTAIPTMAIALAVYLLVGLMSETHPVDHSVGISAGLRDAFFISPWLMLAPCVTIALCLMRVKTIYVLLISAAIGAVCMLLLQPHIVGLIDENGVLALLRTLSVPVSIETGDSLVDGLAATSGIMGMIPTIFLIACAMMLGSALIGTGMLQALTVEVTRRLLGRTRVVTATVGSGLMLNMCTSDQYMSLILGGHIYAPVYERAGLEPKLLSRTLEDSISVTSPIVPWNSCGLTQSAVLGVSTLVYLPYCLFNILQPLMSVFAAKYGPSIRRRAAILMHRKASASM